MIEWLREQWTIAALFITAAICVVLLLGGLWGIMFLAVLGWPTITPYLLGIVLVAASYTTYKEVFK